MQEWDSTSSYFIYFEMSISSPHSTFKSILEVFERKLDINITADEAHKGKIKTVVILNKWRVCKRPPKGRYRKSRNLLISSCFLEKKKAH